MPDRFKRIKSKDFYAVKVVDYSNERTPVEEYYGPFNRVETQEFLYQMEQESFMYCRVIHINYMERIY